MRKCRHYTHFNAGGGINGWAEQRSVFNEHILPRYVVDTIASMGHKLMWLRDTDGWLF
jgi:hypothetical protein